MARLMTKPVPARSAVWAMLIAGVTLGLWGVLSATGAAGQPGRLVLRVELVEQAECVVSRDEYRVSFEMRTSYVNEGSAPVSLDLGNERIVRASFVAEGVSAGDPEAAVSFALPPGILVRPGGLRSRTAVVQPGWAVSGHTVVWAPLTTGASSEAFSLEPGVYTARFEVVVMAAETSAEDAGGTRHQPLRLSTLPLAVTTRASGQVQECGSFSVPLPPEV